MAADDTRMRSGGDAPPTGIRAAVNRHRHLAVITGMLMFAVGTALVVWTWRVYWTPFHETIEFRSFYTVDDGKTWFVDSAERVPPFDHGGKPAVRAHLFSCDNGKTAFVGYLQKIPDQVMQHYRDRGIDPATVDDDDLAEEGGWAAKRPGGSEWSNSKTDHDRYLQVLDVRCPDGSGSATEVVPP
jgi:hypothetical protein